MPQGTALVDFGVFPGQSDASLFVAAPTIGAGNLVEAWIFPAATADHTADEHVLETIKVVAGNVVAASGFTIYMSNTSEINEPVDVAPASNTVHQSTATAVVQKVSQPAAKAYGGGQGTRLYGKWNVGWVFN